MIIIKIIKNKKEMKPLLILILKVICTIIASYELWINLIISGILYDSKYIDKQQSIQMIWEKNKK